jgi:hypothetical protein
MVPEVNRTAWSAGHLVRARGGRRVPGPLP